MSKVSRFILDFCVIAGSMIGSAMVAANLGQQFIVIGYALFLIAGVASVIILKATKGAGSLLFINCYFTIVNIIGLIRYSS